MKALKLERKLSNTSEAEGLQEKSARPEDEQSITRDIPALPML